MSEIIYLDEAIFEATDSEETSELPNVEEILEDHEAMRHLGEDAFHLLVSGFYHRKQRVRIGAIRLLAEKYPCARTAELFGQALLDRKEKREIRFLIARQFVFHEKLEQDLEPLVEELVCSKGCNDRIVAAILMGRHRSSTHSFRLLHLLDDSNDCVKVAAFLSLMQYSRGSLLAPLHSFLKEADEFQLLLLSKNLHYYETSTYFQVISEILSEKLTRIKSRKMIYHPEYYEQAYSQEKLSKLDRLDVPSDNNDEMRLSLFEV